MDANGKAAGSVELKVFNKFVWLRTLVAEYVARETCFGIYHENDHGSKPRK